MGVDENLRSTENGYFVDQRRSSCSLKALNIWNLYEPIINYSTIASSREMNGYEWFGTLGRTYSKDHKLMLMKCTEELPDG